MKYIGWNKAIGEHFFNQEKAGQKVYLYVTEEVLNHLGKPFNEDTTDFIAAVKQGYGLAQEEHNVCDAALKWVTVGWENLDPFEYPPYLAYLALFVLAAGQGEEGDYHQNAYYQRLNDLLGNDHPNVQSQDFAKVTEVWADLARWSDRSQHGRLGFFEVQVAGNHAHVGIPIAQTLLAEQEREALTQIFAETGLNALFMPSREELAALVWKHGKHRLRSRNLRLLQSPPSESSGFRGALLEAITEVLEQWDGTTKPPTPVPNQINKPRVHGTLVPILSFGPFGGLKSIQVRCMTPPNGAGDFPEGGLSLKDGRGKAAYVCSEYRAGWSTPLKTRDGQVFDATSFDWTSAHVLRDQTHKWTFRWHAAHARIFVNGRPYGLPGYVEARQVSLGAPMLLAVQEDLQGLVEAWGQDPSTNEGFRDLGSKGLPRGWKLYNVDSVKDTTALQENLPAFAPTTEVRLTLIGGIRHTRPDEYFCFAPPSIQVHSPRPVTLTCLGHELRQVPPSGQYRLPDELIAQHGLTIKVYEQDQVVKSKRLFLHNQIPWPQQTEYQRFDSFGKATNDEGVSGALIPPRTQPTIHFSTYPLLHTFGKRRVFLIGQEVGQIVSWPQEGIPDWDIVWAVPMQRAGSVVYCGNRLPGPTPIRGTALVSSKKRKRWYTVLYVNRKRITAPNHPQLGQLWRDYQRMAKHAR